MILRIILVMSTVLLLATGCGSARRERLEARRRGRRERVRRHRPADRRPARLGHVDPHRPERRPPPVRAGHAERARRRAGAARGPERRGYDAFMQRLEDASPSSKRIGDHRSPTFSACTARTRTRTSGTTCRCSPRSQRRSPLGSSTRTRRTRRRTAAAFAASTTSLGPLNKQVARIKASFAGTPGRVHRARARLPPRGGGTERTSRRPPSRARSRTGRSRHRRRSRRWKR